MKIAKDVLRGNPIGISRSKPASKKYKVHVHVQEEYDSPDNSSWRKERAKRHAVAIKHLENHPAMKDDNVAAQMSRDAIQREIKVRKAEMVVDEARDE